MHNIPDIYGKIQFIAFGPRGTPELLAAATLSMVPAIITALPLLTAINPMTDDDATLVRMICETIIAAKWDWPYVSDGGTSMDLAIQTLATLPAPVIVADMSEGTPYVVN